MLHIIHLPAQEARRQPLELVGRIGDVEAEGAMLGGSGDVGCGPFGRSGRPFDCVRSPTRPHSAQDDKSHPRR